MSDLSEERLRERLAQSEDPWVERKQSLDEQEVRRTVVAFANTVPDGQVAVLFIGAHNRGEHKYIGDADAAQKKVRGILDRCYPPIRYQMKVLVENVEKTPREILAVMVSFSTNRPHFAGPAYIRRGSETIEASPEVFQDLIASQNDKARRILQFKDKRIRLRIRSRLGFWYDFDALVTVCDAHSVTCRDDIGVHHTFTLPSVEIESTFMQPLLMTVTTAKTDEEHMREMVDRWVRFRNPPTPGEYQLSSDWLVSQFLANPNVVLQTVATLADSSENLWLRLLHLHVRFALKKIEYSTPRHQKLRRLEARFREMMKGQMPFSNSAVVAAVVHSTVEVATSLTEAGEFLKYLAKRHPGVAQVSDATLWNVLLWELKL